MQAAMAETNPRVDVVGIRGTTSSLASSGSLIPYEQHREEVPQTGRFSQPQALGRVLQTQLLLLETLASYAVFRKDCPVPTTTGYRCNHSHRWNQRMEGYDYHYQGLCPLTSRSFDAGDY